MRRLAVLVALAALTFGGLSAAPAAAAPAPPVITSPVDDTNSCTPPGGTFVVAGTAAPAATVSVHDYHAGVIGSAVADDSGHWSVTATVAQRLYDLWADARDETGTSLPSASVDLAFDPPFVEVAAAPEVISPANHDGVADRAVVSVTVRSAGVVHISILKRSEVVGGEPVAGSPGNYDARQGETITWAWGGRDAEGHLVPSGDYAARVEWASPQDDCATQTPWSYLRVDNEAPRFAAVIHNVDTFYPRRDDAFGPYRDWAVITVLGVSDVFYVNGRAEVFRHGGKTPVFVGTDHSWPAGSNGSWWWRGTAQRAGRYLPEGRYDVRFRLSDVAGNVRYTPRTTVALSHRHVVAHTVTLRKAAGGYASVVRSGGCGSVVSSRLSRYDQGALLRYCGSSGSDALAVHWTFTVPRAVAYGPLTPFVYGWSPAGTPLPFMVRNYRSGGTVAVGRAWPAERSHALAAVSGGPFVSRYRTFRLIGRFAGASRAAYDLRTVGVTVRYGTLQE